MHICVHGHWGMFSLATRVLLIWVIQAPRILHPWWPARCSLALASTGSLVRLQTHKNAYKSALPSGWEHVLWSQTLGVQLLARPLTGYMILGSHVTSLSLICTMRIIIVFILNVLLQVNTYRRLEQCLAHDNLLYRCWYKNMKKMQSILLTKKKKAMKTKDIKEVSHAFLMWFIPVIQILTQYTPQNISWTYFYKEIPWSNKFGNTWPLAAMKCTTHISCCRGRDPPPCLHWGDASHKLLMAKKLEQQKY